MHTLQQQATTSLSRATDARTRRYIKAHREAVKAVARVLMQSNRKSGHKYNRKTMDALK